MRPLRMMVFMALLGCTPARDPETLDKLTKIEARLAHIEEELAAQKQAPPAPVAAETPRPAPAPAPAAPEPARASEPEPAAKPTRVTLSGTIKLEGPYAAGAMSSIVALRPLEGHVRARRPGHYSMQQSGKQFSPRVLAVPVGSQVSFPNNDRFFHNVFSLSQTKPFDLGAFKPQMSRDVTFDRPGVVQVLCNLHALMSAYIVVLEDPYFTVADEAGHFALRDLAPGRYRLRVWNERSKKGLEKDIDVAAGQPRLTLALVADTPPSTPPDKHGKPRSAGY